MPGRHFSCADFYINHAFFRYFLFLIIFGSVSNIFRQILGPSVGEIEQLPYSLPAILQYHQQRANRITPIPKPVGIDPQELLKEREFRY